MAQVKLLGELGRLFGRSFNLQIQNPIDALRLIACQTPGFVEYLAQSESNGVYWRVVTETPEGLSVEELAYPIKRSTLIIAPIVTGAGGFGRILAGVALIGAAFLVPGGFLGISATTIGLFGASLVLGGVAQMLTPKNKTPKESEKTDSQLFNEASGTTNQGRCVPIVIGEYLATGMPVISQGLTVNEIPVNYLHQLHSSMV